MSTLQVANIHFESTANNRLQYASNGVTLFTGGSQAFFANSTVITGPGGNQIPAPPSATQGAILYFNGTSWVSLAAGDSGQFLQTQGTGANPVWAQGGLRPTTLHAGALGSSNNFSINVSTGDASTMYEYLEIAGSISTSNAGTSQDLFVHLSGDNGTTYGTGVGISGQSISATATGHVNFKIYNTKSTTSGKIISGFAAQAKAINAVDPGAFGMIGSSNAYPTSNTVTNVRFYMPGGPFDADTNIVVIGWK